MAIVYLNKDKSVFCDVKDSGKFVIVSNHTNKNNLKTLIDHLSNLVSVEKLKGKMVVNLNKKPYAVITNSGEITYLNPSNMLTSFETRLFAQSKNVNNLPFERFEKQPVKLKTDLHTHFAGALTPEQLIDCGIGNNVVIPKWILDKVGIDYSYLKPSENNGYKLEDVISSSQNTQLLINAMKIDTSEQETFNKMEEIYAIRGPFTKNPQMFIPIIKEIANDCKNNGVKYIELSLSSIISDVNQLKELEVAMPAIEKETGVHVRFLGALWRHSDKEWNDDETDRLKVTAQSPYIVGCDVMGHETNSTMEFYDNIKELAKYAIKNDPDFVIRVHAGENPLFKANVRQVLLAVEEAHYELSQEGEKNLPYPQVRLGHGIYGFDEPAPWDEKERTKNITTLQLCDEIEPIIEFNMSSNLSLNNINSLREIPIKKYIDNGVDIVLGTDGKGIYSTDLDQELILAHEAGLTADDFKKIAQTEDEIIKLAQHRFEHHKNCNLTSITFQLQNCYENGAPKYNDLVAKKYSEEHAKLQYELSQKIQSCGAITDINQIQKDIASKKPILITGSSQKHWPKISDENKLKIQIALDVLIHSIDTDNAYLVTGGTNHGVEKEAHILANKFNNNGGNIIVLGTLTEEAMNTDTNSIEPNTITHAIIPTLNGKPAKRWFDLPDTVLNMVGEQDGTIVAIGGGPIVSDMIQRSHNLRLDLNIMSDVEGASGDKSIFFNGNNYDFGDAKDLVLKLLSKAKGFIKQDITSEKLDEMIEESYKRLTVDEDEKVVNKNEKKTTLKTKTLKLTSLDSNKYPDMKVECLVIDNMKEFVELYIKKLKEKGEYPKQAQKSAFVTARPGVIGEIVDTRPRVSRNGNIYTIGETKNQVKIEGSMIVKSPDGEEYIVASDTFAKKYKQTSKEGVYEPIAEPITYITLNHDIVFKAPWGEEMYAAKGAVLNISDLNNVYAIQNEAFKNTYSQNVLNNDGFQK